ncbi:MAG: hypothetical protein K5686_11140 [Lachnospiraceae bacterium]|nr:hypothetical protein [Lachnospiraceae bacterium]
MEAKNINIEEIMNGIRADIAAKGYRESELRLPDIMQYYTDDMKPSLFSRIKSKVKRMIIRK